MLAAGLGFGLSQLGPVSGLPALDRLTSDLASQKADIGQLRANLANLASEAPDGSGIDPAAVAALQDSTARIEEDLQRLTALATAADTRAGELEQRLAAVEKRPAAGDGAGDGASAAYEGEVQALRDDLAAQRAASETVAAQVQTLASDIQARIDASEAAAKAGVQRAALNRLRAAMDSGGDLMPALVELRDSGAEIPAALDAAAQSGVASLPDLQRRFPQAARAALSATVKVSQDDGVWGRMGAFLRSQTGARSLTPREGDDPDAILSRAEAALAGGDLDKALGELSALPEDAAAAMAEWSGAASFRLDATRAADELNMALNG
ncbi:MAG: hypothetical protein R3D84_01200 [Paracoccaceae bacterium]